MKNIIFLFNILWIATLFSQNYNINWSNKISDNTYNINLHDEHWFGFYAEPIGDLNNDGIVDVAVSAIKDNDGGVNRGAIFIFFMDAYGGFSNYQKISQLQGGFSGQLSDFNRFGTGLKYLGDLDNDGNFELAVAAEYDYSIDYRAGSVYILSIDSNGIVQNHVRIPDSNNMLNLSVWDVFGSDLTTVGDLNNDGTIDLAVGSRRYNDEGAVYILFMNPDLSIGSFTRIASNEGGFGPIGFQDYFGGAVANIGDLNNDGIPELAVGAYRDDDGGINTGAIYILFLDQTGNVTNYQKISETVGGFTDNLINDTFFGLSLSETKDINNDGLKEIIVSASGFQDSSLNQYGAFYILNLNSDGTVNNQVKYTNGQQNLNIDSEIGDGFAMSVADINMTYTNDFKFIIGSYFDVENSTEYQRGSFYVVSLGNNLSLQSINKTKNKFYPNPTSNKIYIENHSNLISVQVFDQTGRKIMELKNNLSEIDFSYLPVGSYLMKLNYNDNRFETFKLLKK